MKTTYSRQSIAAYNRTRYGQHTGVSQTLLRETIHYESTDQVVEIVKDAEWLVASKTNQYHRGEAGFPRYYRVYLIDDGKLHCDCQDERTQAYCKAAVEAFWQGQVA